MKNTFRVLLALALAVVMVLSLVACNTQTECEKGNHTWDDGVVTKAATCSEKGTLTKTCTVEGCGATTTEDIAIDTTAHAWGAWSKAENNKHTRVCSNNSAHTESVDCSFATTYKFDATKHWHECSVCGNVTGEANHDFTTKSYECVCGMLKTTNFTTTSIVDCAQNAPASGESEKVFAIGKVESIDPFEGGEDYNGNPKKDYGNLYINDGAGNKIYVYGTYSADGSVLYQDMTENKPAVGDVIVVYGVLTQYKGTPQLKNAWVVEYNGTKLADQDTLVINDLKVPTLATENFTLSNKATWALKAPVDGIAVDGTSVTVKQSAAGEVNFTLVATVGTLTKEFNVSVPELVVPASNEFTATDLGLVDSYGDSIAPVTVGNLTITWTQLYSKTQGIQMRTKEGYAVSSFVVASQTTIVGISFDWNSGVDDKTDKLFVEFSTTENFAEGTVSDKYYTDKNVGDPATISAPAGDWRYVRVTHNNKGAVYLDKVDVLTKAICKTHASENVKFVDAVPHTCTQDGTVAYYTCILCDTYYADQACTTPLATIVDPAAHTLSDVIRVEADCLTDGNVAYKHCSVCSKNFVDGQETDADDLVIPAKGHSTPVGYTHEGCTAGFHKQVCENDNCPTTFTEVACTLVWYSGDATQHWKACSLCNYETEKTAHDADAVECQCGKVSDPVVLTGTLNGEAVSARYATLAAAVAYVNENAATFTATDSITIKMLNDESGAGIDFGVEGVASIKAAITIDLNGKTYTVTEPPVGSANTVTNGLRFLKDQTITIKNGTINVVSGNTKVKMLIQNYANLTLQGVTIDGTNLAGTKTVYTLSNNNGNVTIDATSTIKARGEGDFAFDACEFGGYAGVTVTLANKDSVVGNIQFYIDNADANVVLNLPADFDLAKIDLHTPDCTAAKIYLGESDTVAFGHVADTVLSSDASGHWHECTRCDQKADAVVSHTDSWKHNDNGTACVNTCSVEGCGYQIATHAHDLTAGPCEKCGNFTPAENVIYKLGVFQGDASLNKNFYFNGKIDDNYLSTVEALNDGYDVKVKLVDDGFNLYFTTAAGTKYINLNSSGKIVLGDTAETAYTYEVPTRSITSTVSGTKYYIGTYNQYTTLGGSKFSYLSNDGTTVKANQYPAYLVAGCKHENLGAPVAAVAPDCTTDGSLAYAVCSDCGKNIVNGTTIDTIVVSALGHDYQDIAVLKAGDVITHDGGEVTIDADNLATYQALYHVATCHRDGCGAVNAVAHTKVWTKDADSHSFTCSVEGCGYASADAPHNVENGICKDCQKQTTTLNVTITPNADAETIYANNGNADTTDKYYFMGVISEIKSTTYGNIYIVDEAGNSLYVYGLYSFDGETRYDGMASKPQVGDLVVVNSIVSAHNGAVQLKNARLVEWKGVEQKESADYVLAQLTVSESAAADFNLPTYKDFAITWTSNNTAIAIQDGVAKVTRSKDGDVTVTLTASVTVGEETKTKDFTVVVAKAESVSAGEIEVSYVAKDQGLSRGDELGTYTNMVTITFDKGSNSDAPKYYDDTDKEQMRFYANNLMTITAPEGKVITKIVFVLSSDDNTTSETHINNVAFTGTTWTGESSEVVFKVVGSSQRRIMSMTITLDDPCTHEDKENKAAELPTCAEPGKVAYVHCNDCGNNYATTDTAFENPLTSLVDATAPATGNHAYADGVCSVCGAEEPVAGATTYSYTFEKDAFTENGQTSEFNGVAWTLTGTGNGNPGSLDSTKGLQFGSKNNPYTTLTLTSAEFNSVSKVRINISGASSVQATFIVKVNGEQVGEATTVTTTATEYEFGLTEPVTGKVEIVVTVTQRAVYIKSLEVDYVPAA